jgi:hypothetical protein
MGARLRGAGVHCRIPAIKVLKEQSLGRLVAAAVTRESRL